MKKNKSKYRLSVSNQGITTLIYSDIHADLLSEGKATIKRVSNVEPSDGGWVASMFDGTKLGPYKLRQQALDEEVKYIEEKLL